MKFSEKGLKSFADQMLNIALKMKGEDMGWDRDYAIRKLKFEEDDFDGVGAVVLSVDDAEYLTWLIHSLYDAVEMYDSFREERFEQVKDGYDILCPKIAKAKGER